MDQRRGAQTNPRDHQRDTAGAPAAPQAGRQQEARHGDERNGDIDQMRRGRIRDGEPADGLGDAVVARRQPCGERHQRGSEQRAQSSGAKDVFHGAR
jgi:hypothetical protein